MSEKELNSVVMELKRRTVQIGTIVLIIVTILMAAKLILANPIPVGSDCSSPPPWGPKLCPDGDDHPAKCEIYGYIKTTSGASVSGVTVRADNGGSSTTTSSTGYYSVRVFYEWSGKVTPSKSGWTFDPSSIPYTNVTSNRGNQNYTAYGPDITISGYIRTADGSGIPGVFISTNNGGSSTTTNSNGYYSVRVPYGWSGQVTPSKTGWKFDPSNISYTDLISGRTNENYTGTPPPTEISGIKWNDLDGDGVQDAEEPRLVGWKIYLDSNHNGQWESGEPYRLTNASGQYSFSNLPAGTYYVAEELKNDWQQTFPSTSKYTVILSAGSQRSQIDFGNKKVIFTPRPEMPIEDMHIEITEVGGELHAVFKGDYTFTFIPDGVTSMLFPVPPDASNIRVWQDDQELPWTMSSLTYPTVLPEMETIPMIEWQGPFPEDGTIFGVDYEHDLIKRNDEFVFFYALGTGGYTPSDGTIVVNSESTDDPEIKNDSPTITPTTAFFDILLPMDYHVKSVSFDNIPTHMYEVIDSHLILTVVSPSRDLIVTLAPGSASQGSLVGWGSNTDGQQDVPPGNDFVAISAGGSHSLALKSDRSIIGWGNDSYGQTTPPAGNEFVAIAAGGYHSLALKKDGSIIGWGHNSYGQAIPPAGNEFVAIAAGWQHSLALKNDGSITGWGDDGYGQATPPTGSDFMAISAGYYHGLALKNDGTIVGWGYNGYGQATPPTGNAFMAISAGYYHGLALKNDGSIVGWGYNGYGQATPPAGNDFVAITSGWRHSLSLKKDGSIVGWGNDGHGQATPPAGHNFISIDAGYHHSLAILQIPVPTP